MKEEDKKIAIILGVTQGLLTKEEVNEALVIYQKNPELVEVAWKMGVLTKGDLHSLRGTVEYGVLVEKEKEVAPEWESYGPGTDRMRVEGGHLYRVIKRVGGSGLAHMNTVFVPEVK
jgi:hypothetical protein